MRRCLGSGSRPWGLVRRLERLSGRILGPGCARVLRLRGIGFGVRGCASGLSRSGGGFVSLWDYWGRREMGSCTSGLLWRELTTDEEKDTGLSL